MDKNTFIFNARSVGRKETVAELTTEWETLNNELNPAAAPDPIAPEQQPGISDLVSDWLKGLKDTDPDQFEAIRKAGYADQYAAWDAAGRVGEGV